MTRQAWNTEGEYGLFEIAGVGRGIRPAIEVPHRFTHQAQTCNFLKPFLMGTLFTKHPPLHAAFPQPG